MKTKRDISQKYWENRYIDRGHTSGAGSYGNILEQKIKVIDNFIKDKESIKSILDVGCGDLNTAFNFLPLFPKAKYVGIDIAERWIKFIKENKQKDSPLNFKCITDSIFDMPSDLVLCLDVLFHVMDDKDYDNMLKSLKRSWKRWLVISTYNKNNSIRSNYIKVRGFKPEYFGNCEEIILPQENYRLYIFKK